MLRLGRGEGNLRHQLVADNGQHLLQLGAVGRGEALGDAAHHLVHIVVVDIVVVNILLGGAQVVLPLVVLGLKLLHIALFDQAVDLIGGIGGRDLHK